MAVDEDRTRLARALSAFWYSGAGPTHDEVTRAFDVLDLEERVEVGSKRDRVHDAVLIATDAELPRLMGELVDLLHEGGYLHADIPGRPGEVALLKKRLKPFGLDLTPEGAVIGGAGLGLDPAELLDAPQTRDHVRRLQLALTTVDSELLLGSSKELIETVCKVVLDGAPEMPSKFPALLSKALDHIGLSPRGTASADPDVAEPTRKILGGLQQIGLGINDLRNAHGTGHGRASTVRLGDRQARLAAGSAIVLAKVMLDTFEDPNAPWRSGSTSAGPARGPRAST